MDTSKAMVRFLNKPLIDFIVFKLAKQGVREFYLGVSGYVNYTGLFDHLGSGERITYRLGLKDEEVRIRYQPNIESRGNAESVKIVMDYYDIREHVLVVQGDVVFDVDLSDLWIYHNVKDSYMTIVLKEIEDVERLRHYGVAELCSDYRIERFVEKPSPSEAPSRLVNTGIYLLSPQFRDFFDYGVGRKLLERGELDFGRHVIPKLIECGYGVYGYVYRGYWFDIGTPESYKEAVFYLLKVLSPEELEVDHIHYGIRFMGKTQLSRMLRKSIIDRLEAGDIVLEGDILLGRHVFLGSKVRITNSVIDHYTIVSDGAVIEDSVVMDRCFIGSRSRVVNSVVGRHVRIGSNVVIENSVVGNNVVVGDNVSIINSKVWPNKVVKGSSTIKDSLIS